MKIIEKIEVKNFRSIKELTLDFNSSVSIFSGTNSCGKTNILRALNLFFNDEVGFGQRLKSSDIFVKENETPAKFISIQVWFDTEGHEKIEKQKKVAKRFSILKKWNFTTGFINESSEQIATGEKKGKRLTEGYSDFLNKWAKFHYIPTDRKVFFKKIKSELSEFLGSPFGYSKLKKDQSKIYETFQKLEKSLGDRDSLQLKVPDDIKKQIEISDVGYSMPGISNLLKVLDFKVTKKNGEKYFISTEGDGIKFVNLLQIIKIFDARSLTESRTRPYFSIWGIDEPENSFEQKNIEAIKKILLEIYSADTQLFLTSHSPEFLLEPDQTGRNRFYGFENINGETVPMLENDSAPMLPFTEFEREILIEKMGIGMSREEKMALKKELEGLKEKNDELNAAIYSSTKPILLVEDEYDQIYKIAWLKLNEIECETEISFKKFDEKCSFKIHRMNGRINLQQKLLNKFSDDLSEKKVIGLFDFDDGFGDFNGLKNDRNDQRAMWPEKINGDEIKECLWKTRIDNKNIHAMMIPIPEARKEYASQSWLRTSHLSIEHLIDDENWKKIGVAISKKQDTDRGIEYSDLKGRKKNYWKKLFDLKKEDFENFKPLFEKIDELFKV
jgi:AAA15 family ATPase/GTPase